jgi:hypothetical protein
MAGVSCRYGGAARRFCHFDAHCFDAHRFDAHRFDAHRFDTYGFDADPIDADRFDADADSVGIPISSPGGP